MVAVVVCIDHVRDWLVGDLVHRCPDVPAHLVRAARVDEDHAFVAYDDRRIDHVALVGTVRVLDGTQKDVHPVVDLERARFRKRLPVRCRAEGHQGDQSAQPSHGCLGLTSKLGRRPAVAKRTRGDLEWAL